MYPWIEKYRPTQFIEMKLDDKHRIIFNNIVKNGKFNNMLFYGPPGTGKTTAITCLLNDINKLHGYSENIIHLNASDDRGVDTMRNNIYTFVNNKTILNSKMKFVILDEVDSMTKSAQNSLIHLLDNCNENVNYCLICNYISKITESIRKRCIVLYFKQIPRENKKEYLNHIIKEENINISEKILDEIIMYGENDIRSMVNMLQQYKNENWVPISFDDIKILCDKYSTNIINKYKDKDIKEFYKILFQYIIDNKNYDLELIIMMKNLMQNTCIPYFINIFMPYYKKLNNN